MPTIVSFEDINAWQTARELTRMVHDLTRHGEFARDFGLCDQMRRASVSIPSNITEGFESRVQPLFKDYLGRAKAFAVERRAQTYVRRTKDIWTRLSSCNCLNYAINAAANLLG